MRSLREEGLDDRELVALQTDLDKLAVDDKEKALLELAVAMIEEPSAANGATLRAHQAGWSDDELETAIVFIAFFDMKTTIYNALGRKPNPSHPYAKDATIPLLHCGSP